MHITLHSTAYTFGENTSMRINRGPSTRNVRRSSCMPMTLLYGILLGSLVASVAWMTGRFDVGTTPDERDLLRAQAAFNAGDLDDAIRYAENAWQSNPELTDALGVLVQALIYRSYGDYDGLPDREIALSHAATAQQNHIGDLAVLALYAFALQAAHQPVEAARIAEQVLNRQPENVTAQLARGLAFGQVGSYETALQINRQAYQHAIASGQWELDALRALAISLGDLGRYDDAADTVKQALEINDRLLVLYFERAFYAMQAGDADAATAAYFRVLAFDDDNIKARLRLCELSSLLRESENALLYCGEVTTAAPTWYAGWYHLGREHFLLGQFEDAQTALNRCSTLQIAQNVPIEDRELDCWYLQGQAAELRNDCPGLMTAYTQFRAMVALADLPQTWTYPPEGPSICIDSP